MVLGAGVCNVKTLEELAKTQDIELIIADGNPGSIGKQYTTMFECIDITSGKIVLEVAERYKINGIYAMNDHGITAAAYVSEMMGLKGISIATARVVTDKGYMREVWRIAGLPQPTFDVIKTPGEIEDFAMREGYPVVIKPVDCGGGGRGVYVITNRDQIKTGYEICSKYLIRNKRLIVEKFVEGTETSVEAIRIDNEIYLIAYSDKYKPPYKFRVATSIHYPGDFSNRVVNKIRKLTDLAMRAVGIYEGVAHLEFIIGDNDTGENIWIIEMSSRVGGGHTFHPIASHVAGINYPESVAKLCLGEAIIPNIKTYRGACYRFFDPNKSGTLVEVNGIENVKNLKGVYDISIWKKIGEKIGALENSLERTGSIVTLGENRGEAKKLADLVEKSIEITISRDSTAMALAK